MRSSSSVPLLNESLLRLAPRKSSDNAILLIVNPLKKIFSYTSNLRRVMVVVGLMSVGSALLALATPFVIKYATDWIVAITTGDTTFTWEFLFVLVGAVIAIALLTVVTSDVGGFWGDQLAVRTRRQLSTLYYKHLLRLPQSYYDNEVSGKIINRLSRAITDITNFLQFFSNNLLQMLLTMVISVGIMVYYSWPIAALFLLLIPANLYLTARTSGKWQKYETKKNHHFDIASGRFAEAVGQMRLIKSFGTERRELKQFDDRLVSMARITRKQSRYWHSMNAVRGVVFGMINGALYGILFYETATGKLSLGDMTMLLTLIAQISFPLRNLSFFVDSYQRAVANSNDYIAALQETPEPDDANTKQLVVKDGLIEYRNVDFAYDDKANVLHAISFTIEPGKKLALVGESGGGKTTISNLLMGLYQPRAGEIVIDGQSLSDVTRTSLRAQIATVFQEASLFSGTIRENIAYARPDASDQDIARAAKAANATNFIAKLENGLDTEIGERGIKLSGGQKQRIAIARAILKNAPILILDEATSSLDSRAEHEVQQALDRLMKGRTVLIIAHRLSTIAAVDTIVTLRNGRVDETGAPHELASSGGIYQQLLELQLGATETAKKKLAAFDIASD